MSSVYFDLTSEDAWILQRLGAAIAERLVNSSDLRAADRRSLLRAIFALQKFPEMDFGVNLIVRGPSCSLHMSCECLSLQDYSEDNHTANHAEFFIDSSHCFSWNELLTGWQKQEVLEILVSGFEDEINSDGPLSITDYCEGEGIDKICLMNPGEIE